MNSFFSRLRSPTVRKTWSVELSPCFSRGLRRAKGNARSNGDVKNQARYRIYQKSHSFPLTHLTQLLSRALEKAIPRRGTEHEPQGYPPHDRLDLFDCDNTVIKDQPSVDDVSFPERREFSEAEYRGLLHDSNTVFVLSRQGQRAWQYGIAASIHMGEQPVFTKSFALGVQHAELPDYFRSSRYINKTGPDYVWTTLAAKFYGFLFGLESLYQEKHRVLRPHNRVVALFDVEHWCQLKYWRGKLLVSQIRQLHNRISMVERSFSRLGITVLVQWIFEESEPSLNLAKLAREAVLPEPVWDQARRRHQNEQAEQLMLEASNCDFPEVLRSAAHALAGGYKKDAIRNREGRNDEFYKELGVLQTRYDDAINILDEHGSNKKFFSWSSRTERLKREWLLKTPQERENLLITKRREQTIRAETQRMSAEQSTTLSVEIIPSRQIPANPSKMMVHSGPYIEPAIVASPGNDEFGEDFVAHVLATRLPFPDGGERPVETIPQASWSTDGERSVEEPKLSMHRSPESDMESKVDENAKQEPILPPNSPTGPPDDVSSASDHADTKELVTTEELETIFTTHDGLESKRDVTIHESSIGIKDDSWYERL